MDYLGHGLLFLHVYCFIEFSSFPAMVGQILTLILFFYIFLNRVQSSDKVESCWIEPIKRLPEICLIRVIFS